MLVVHVRDRRGHSVITILPWTWRPGSRRRRRSRARHREFTARRQEVIAANPELQEREALKGRQYDQGGADVRGVEAEQEPADGGQHGQVDLKPSDRPGVQPREKTFLRRAHVGMLRRARPDDTPVHACTDDR